MVSAAAMIRSRTSAFGAARRPSRYGRGMTKVDLVNLLTATVRRMILRPSTVEHGRGTDDGRGTTSGHGTAGPCYRDSRCGQRSLPRNVLRGPGTVRHDQRYRYRRDRRVERRACVATP